VFIESSLFHKNKKKLPSGSKLNGNFLFSLLPKGSKATTPLRRCKMDKVLLASALTRVFLEQVLGLKGLDAEVVHAIIGWTYTHQDCAECGSHQEKLEEMLALTLSGCDQPHLLPYPEGPLPDAGYN
jgi:hypothetical protein